MTVAAQGEKAAIASYEDFARSTQLVKCEIAEPQIDLVGDTAIASYPWTISYLLEGRRYDESGREIVVLMRDEVRWLVRWRTLLLDSREVQ